MYTVDLNCDLGESYGGFTVGADSAVIPFISSANVGCGYHGGDPLVMSKTVELCKAAGVKIGAHPSYPDLMGFGRRAMDCTPAEVKAYVTYQIGALYAFLRSKGEKLQHVKPHGALYNAAGKDVRLAYAVAEAAQEFDDKIMLLGLSGSAMQTAAKDVGIAFKSEVFADRGYEEDGSLVKRGTAGDMITDDDLAIKRVIQMVKKGTVIAKTGKEIEIKADSVCVHGDGKHALTFVKSISKALKENGITVKNLGD